MEILEHIYQDSDMSVSTLDRLLEDLEDKKSSSKDTVKHLKDGHERYQKKAENLLKERGEELKEGSIMGKMMSKKGVDQKIKKDATNEAIVDMLIKGITMGVKDIDHALKKDKDMEKDDIKLAIDFLQFQKDNIESLEKLKDDLKAG